MTRKFMKRKSGHVFHVTAESPETARHAKEVYFLAGEIPGLGSSEPF
jgi:hypothetical protein